MCLSRFFFRKESIIKCIFTTLQNDTMHDINNNESRYPNNETVTETTVNILEVSSPTIPVKVHKMHELTIKGVNTLSQ